MSTLKDYVAAKRISVEILSGPDYVSDEGSREGLPGWEHHLYELRLHHGALGTSMDLPWKQGMAITSSPDDEPETILDCVIGDSWTYFQADSFEDWCGEYGLDTDSRRAYGMWEAVMKEANSFLSMLGDDRDELETLALRTDRSML